MEEENKYERSSSIINNYGLSTSFSFRDDQN